MKFFLFLVHVNHHFFSEILWTHELRIGISLSMLFIIIAAPPDFSASGSERPQLSTADIY
jgi:hypothetical protein